MQTTTTDTERPTPWQATRRPRAALPKLHEANVQNHARNRTRPRYLDCITEQGTHAQMRSKRSARCGQSQEEQRPPKSPRQNQRAKHPCIIGRDHGGIPNPAAGPGARPWPGGTPSTAKKPAGTRRRWRPATEPGRPATTAARNRKAHRSTVQTWQGSPTHTGATVQLCNRRPVD